MAAYEASAQVQAEAHVTQIEGVKMIAIDFSREGPAAPNPDRAVSFRINAGNLTATQLPKSADDQYLLSGTIPRHILGGFYSAGPVTVYYIKDESTAAMMNGHQLPQVGSSLRIEVEDDPPTQVDVDAVVHGVKLVSKPTS
ncbi:MAG: hypothetical protein M3169_01890 [Candidatus Eremiobacteraeota bacterium]|nr:hypothetical protein [Candidatus Eremiobacteraeota bacterium]